MRTRDGALLRQHRARGSQRPRPADRGLHLRERAARAALQDPGHPGQPLPPRASSRTTTAAVCSAQGGILTMTSNAERTSPVHARQVGDGGAAGHAAPAAAAERARARGDQADPGTASVLTVRERMEAHRASAACTSCHRMIDPIGLALENFDVTGAWRIKDAGCSDRSIERRCSTERRSTGPASLRNALLNYSDAFVGNSHREPAHVRDGPPRRVSRYADCARDHARRRAAGQPVLVARSRAS